MIAHDLKTFGVYWESRLDEQICNEVIEFTELLKFFFGDMDQVRNKKLDLCFYYVF